MFCFSRYCCCCCCESPHIHVAAFIDSFFFFSQSAFLTSFIAYAASVSVPFSSLPSLRFGFCQIYEAIRNGADAFLSAEYTICCIFIVLFGAVVFFLVGIGQDSWVEGAFTTGAFVLGAVTSILAGYIGMKVRDWGRGY